MQYELSDATVEDITVMSLYNTFDMLQEAITIRNAGGISYHYEDVTTDIEWLKGRAAAVKTTITMYEFDIRHPIIEFK
tara:strand:- start:273 stop:506 length:234 start_codon:yes stop_codon:yes gene_type:complete